MTVTIRSMLRDDIPAVAELEADIYPQPWSPRVFFDELSLENRRYLVATTADGVVIGYCGLLIVEHDAHITTIAVAPGARGHHLGQRLMLALVDVAREAETRHLTLEVRVSNDGAQRLYERFGFDPVGRRKNYYADEDALVMWATDIDNEAYQERIRAIRSSLQEEVA
ncbi:MAG: ribosomal protein S18-alanine N-acetyltransferase [Acidimicrobiia bacterium]